jgi:hypothetical protein
MASRLSLNDIITEECENAIRNGEESAKSISEKIRKHLKCLAENERSSLEQDLMLMISRDDDQVHDPVRH